MKGRFVILILLGAVACSGSPDKTDEETELIGAPPPPSEDPFYFKTMPAEAVPASPTGSIGPDEEGRVAYDPAVSMRCFSCVKICPETDPTCRYSDDVICGWGVHPEESTAARLAEAECEGALDVAREMPRFSSIDGACPAATCQSPQ